MVLNTKAALTWQSRANPANDGMPRSHMHTARLRPKCRTVPWRKRRISVVTLTRHCGLGVTQWPPPDGSTAPSRMLSAVSTTLNDKYICIIVKCKLCNYPIPKYVNNIYILKYHDTFLRDKHVYLVMTSSCTTTHYIHVGTHKWVIHTYM